MINFIITIVIPITCLIVVSNLYLQPHKYANSIKAAGTNVMKFSNDLESSLQDIGPFRREDEGKVVRGELTCNNVNIGKPASKTAKKLNWYAHTRHYYFAGTNEGGEHAAATPEDWFRRQLKSSLGE